MPPSLNPLVPPHKPIPIIYPTIHHPHPKLDNIDAKPHYATALKRLVTHIYTHSLSLLRDKIDAKRVRN